MQVVATDDTGVSHCRASFQEPALRTTKYVDVNSYIGPTDLGHLFEGTLELTAKDLPGTYSIVSATCVDAFGLQTQLQGSDALAVFGPQGDGFVHDTLQDLAIPVVDDVQTTWDEASLMVNTTFTVRDDVSGACVRACVRVCVVCCVCV